MVLRLVPYVLGLTVIVLAIWFLDRHALKTVDWGLLATFAAFFTFSGNLARMEPIQALFARLLSHGTILISALTCQIISNVPAAILLSRFTQDARALLVGVNVGGAGTLVASLASLITFREYTRHVPNGGKSFLPVFWDQLCISGDSFDCHVRSDVISRFNRMRFGKSLINSRQCKANSFRKSSACFHSFAHHFLQSAVRHACFLRKP